MQIEFELRILNIDKQALVRKLESLGAKRVHGEVLQRAYIMDYPDGRLWKQHAWLRIRDVGGMKVECIIKQRLDNTSIRNAQEIYCEINDLGSARELFEFLGLEIKAYREKKRMEYRLGNITFDIDTWPDRKPYLEIESDNEKDIWEMVAKLGYKKSDCIFTAGEPLLTLLGFDIEKQKSIQFTRDAHHR